MKTYLNKLKPSLILGTLLLSIFTVTLSIQATTQPPPPIYTIQLKGAIGPAFAQFFNQSLNTAIDNNAQAFILQLDTPGGLDSSMRDMIQTILSSPIPIITYITPAGARAASAGTYILYASHIAAMTEGTNLGAATPVSLAGPATTNPTNENESLDNNMSAMEKKVINDATAYIESLAQLRNRNQEWAKTAVQEGKSLSAKDALSNNVIDIIATDINDLITQLNQQPININKTSITLNTSAEIITITMDLKSKILSVVTSPDIAYMLLIAGVYCLFFEFSNPGSIIPGVLGSIALIIAVYGLNILPLSTLGLTILFVGVVCLIAEVFVSSYGLLGLVGSILFLIGSMMLFEPNNAGITLSPSLVFSVTALNIGFFYFVVATIIKSHRQPVTTGLQSLVGKVGYTLDSFTNFGQIKINGEIWTAKTNIPLEKERPCVIKSIHNRTLIVNPLKEDSHD